MMTHPTLQALKDDLSLQAAVALIVSPWPIYNGLKSNPSVRAVANAWSSKTLTDAMLTDFVEALLRDFRPKHHFVWEYVLCGLAVAMEHCHGELPEYLLAQIARLQFTETPMAHAVAALCIQGRAHNVGAITLSANLVSPASITIRPQYKVIHANDNDEPYLDSEAA